MEDSGTPEYMLKHVQALTKYINGAIVLECAMDTFLLSQLYKYPIVNLNLCSTSFVDLLSQILSVCIMTPALRPNPVIEDVADGLSRISPH